VHRLRAPSFFRETLEVFSAIRGRGRSEEIRQLAGDQQCQWHFRDESVRREARARIRGRKLAIKGPDILFGATRANRYSRTGCRRLDRHYYRRWRELIFQSSRSESAETRPRDSCLVRGRILRNCANSWLMIDSTEQIRNPRGHAR